MSTAQSDLLRGASPGELIPGDPDGVDRLAQRLLGFSEVFADGAQALGRVEVSWCGPAADAFRNEFSLQPGAFSSAASAFSDAGLALGSHALALDSARSMAVVAVGLWQEGLRAARLALASVVPGGVGDGALLTEPAGSQQRLTAVEKLDAAREVVETSGLRAAAALRSAVSSAPEWTSAWQHLGGFVTNAGTERHDFFAGGLVGLLDMGFSADPTGLTGPVKAQVNEIEWQHGIDPRSSWHTAGSIVLPAVLAGPGGVEGVGARLGLLDTAANKPANVLLYRGMRADLDGLPELGNEAKTLGVRAPSDSDHPDIKPDSQGIVQPGAGGMSANTTIDSIPPFRKGPEDGGKAVDLTMYSVWSRDLDERLVFRVDVGESEGHGTVQPVTPMSIEEYRRLLVESREKWKRVHDDP